MVPDQRGIAVEAERETELRPLRSQRLQRQLRALAAQRLDSEVFNLLRAHAEGTRLGSDDLLVLASALRQSAFKLRAFWESGKPDADADALVDFVFALLESAELPTKPKSGPAFREYFFASIAWFGVLRDSRHVSRFWSQAQHLLGIDLSAIPEGRERLVGEIADIGRTNPLPPQVETVVAQLCRKPHLFGDRVATAKVLAYDLHARIRDLDARAIVEVWLPAWCRAFARARFGRSMGPGSVNLVRADVHERLSMLARMSQILCGRYGGLGTSVSLLLVKLDYWLFVRPGRLGGRLAVPWTAALQALLRIFPSRDPRFSRRRNRRQRIEQNPPIPSLRVIEGTTSRERERDLIVTRAQGGIGDIITMRPGLLELARRRWRHGGRVVFATNRAFFPAFSVDDTLDLLDIERDDIDVSAFGKWINMTEAPEADVETRQKPRIRTHRIDIYARLMGVPFSPFAKRRNCPIRPTSALEQSAVEFVRWNSRIDAPSIGIQYRAAETYKDAPVMLDLARALTRRYNVFVFDSRPIPRQPGDLFVAVDNQSLPAAVAIAARMGAIIAPDSSYIHIAGANGIPCLVLAGPTDGRVRAKAYPHARYLDARRSLSCVPCWRNEFEKCRLTQSYDSACMKMLSVPVVVEALEHMLAARGAGSGR